MAPTPPPPAAIVIAGGRSTRFGSDKLLAEVDGRTLLQRTMEAVSGCATVVLVSATNETVPRGVVIVSEYPRWGGPCAGIAAGVAALPETTTETLIVSADLARPASAVAALHAIETGVLADQDGNVQWLLARVPVPALGAQLAKLDADGGAAGRPVRALIGHLGLPIVPTHRDAVADIDEQHDLDYLKERH
ncbi:molybdenum cofactor guanylyltransferase [Leifsonia shinshuensis]|uniref:molybdenum cofactor guanylyltransferase n=1 Tax=Leifsonia shinshuensis TaxID=150026 RepID=UPI001625C294|nr:NTP transferase domain-containing protein [Leifsonia shinshuensis]